MGGLDDREDPFLMRVRDRLADLDEQGFLVGGRHGMEWVKVVLQTKIDALVVD